MNLVVILGAQAVGKMTVGSELSKITDLKLFYNHMSIELGLQFDSWGTPLFNDINGGIRELVMNSFIKHKRGMIFTFTWAFDLQSDWDYMEHLRQKFKGYTIHYVELVSDISVRMERNITEKRLNAKPSKKNTEWSQNELVQSMGKYRLISNDGEIPYENYIKIDNSNLSAEEVAGIIKQRFSL